MIVDPDGITTGELSSLFIDERYEVETSEGITSAAKRVKDVKFGELDYEGDDLTDIELTIRYDWASITAFSPGAPSPTAPSNAPGVPYWALGGNPVE